MICQNCGSSTNGTFCANCGNQVSMPAPPTNYAWQAQPPTPMTAGSGFSTSAIVLGIIAVFLVPILFGGIGIILAVVGKNKGEKNANVALTVAIVCTVAGLIFGAVVGAATYGS